MTSLGSARVAAAAVPGCQHVLAGGLPCQDAVGTRVGGDRVLLAVADGHGDAAYPRSDEGARLAVSVALDALGALADRLVADAPRADERESLAGSFKRNIAFEWNRRAKHHARMAAERDDNLLLWPTGVTGDWHERLKAYGSTLLGAAFCADLAVWFRLGDGDALGVAQDGRARRIFAAVDKSAGPATFSLSARDCVEHMEVAFDAEDWRLALLASDGVGDQYDIDPSFEEEWGTRLCERLDTRGFGETMLDLPRYLATAAKDGDDCSVALAWFPSPRS